MSEYRKYIQDNLKQFGDYYDQDEALRKQWVRRNEALLREKKNSMSSEDYKNFRNNLYKYQTWQSLEPYMAGSIPFDDTDAWSSRREHLKVWATKSPLYDENDVLDKNNPYWTEDEWNQYNSLDEQGRHEFLDNIRTQEELKNTAARSAQHDYRSAVAMEDAMLGGPGIDWSGISQREASEYVDSNDRKYLQHLKDLTSKQKRAAESIVNRNDERFRESEEFQNIQNPIREGIVNMWNADLEKDPNSKLQHLNTFIDAYSGNLSNDPNSILSYPNKILQAASGGYYKLSPEDRQLYDRLYKKEGKVLEKQPSSEELARVNKVGERMWSQYKDIETEDSDGENTPFRLEYLSLLYALDEAVKAKNISLDSAKRQLDAFAQKELDKREGIVSVAGSAIKGLATQFVTHELDVLAPFVNEGKANIYNHRLKESGRGVFQDMEGNIYPTAAVDAYGMINDDGNGYIFIDKEGNIVDSQTVQEDEEGQFVSTVYNGPEVVSTPVRKVNVGERQIDGRTLVSLGYTDAGESDDSVFNPVYLSKADKYNVMPTNRDELDFWDQYGTSKYTAIQDPTKQFSAEQFAVEAIKMGGFIVGDMLNATILRPLGAAGEGIASIGSAAAIADAYRRGVVEENMMNNREKLQEYLQSKAYDDAVSFINTSEGKEAVENVLDYRLKEAGIDVSSLTDDQKQRYMNAARNEVLNARALQTARNMADSPEMIDRMNDAMSSAVQSSYISFWGEALKYGAINKFGWRGSLFKGASPIERAATAGEAGWFGRQFEKVVRATEEDVAKFGTIGKTIKTGDLIVKEGWDTLTKLQKTGRVATAIGKGAWGGGWTNWTDEMQSAGAKAFNDAIFAEELENPNANGSYMLLNAIAEHNIAAAGSALEPTSIWAFAVGAAGGYFNFVPNATALTLLTHSGMDAFSRASTLEKVGTLFSNQLIQDLTTQKFTDRQAQEILDNWNNLNNQIGDSKVSLVKVLDSATKLGQSESFTENEESSVRQFFNWLIAMDNFSKNNPGLVEFDKDANIQQFKRNAEALVNFSELNDTERQSIVNQIAAENEGMTLDEAWDEIPILADKAQKMLYYVDSYNKLVNSKEYKRVASNTEVPTNEQDRMLKRFELNMMRDFMESALLERESAASGMKAFGPEVTGDTYLSTWGSTANALNQAKRTINFHISSLKDLVDIYKNKDSVKNFDAKAKSLSEKIEASKDDAERESLSQELADLIEDNAYYTHKIGRLENQIESAFKVIQDNFESEKVKEFTKKKAVVLTADQILRLDPVSRMRMLNPKTRDNYSAKQQTEIVKADTELKNKGINYNQIVSMGMGYSRLQQYDEKLADIDAGKPITPSFNSYVTAMHNAAEGAARLVAVDTVRKNFRDINNFSASESEKNAKKIQNLKVLSNAGLDWIVPNLSEADNTLLETIRPLVKLADQVNAVIYGSSEFGNLTFDEKQNMQSMANKLYNDSATPEQFMDAIKALNLSSMNKLADILESAYGQQSSTVTLTANESKTQAAAQSAEAEARATEATAPEATVSPAPEATATSETSRPDETLAGPEGGVIDTVSETLPTSAARSAEVEKVVPMIKETQKKVQPVSERDPHADHYLIDGKRYDRVHGIMSDQWIGADIVSERSKRALVNGSAIDSIVRNFFNSYEVVKPDNMTDESFNALKFALAKLKKQIDDNGETFLADNLVLYHEFDNGVRMAGEVDILSVKMVDGKPEYRIYDIKTSAGDRGTGNAFTESEYWETSTDNDRRNSTLGTKDAYTQQLNAYAELFERRFGVKPKSLSLIPFTLEYADMYGERGTSYNIIGIEAKPNIPIEMNDDMRKVIAYRPYADEAAKKIEEAYPGAFDKSMLDAMKNVLITAALRGEKAGPMLNKLLAYRTYDTAKFNTASKDAFFAICKEFLENAKNADVDKALGEVKPVETEAEPEPAPETVVEETKVSSEYTPETARIPERTVDEQFDDHASAPVRTEYTEVSEETVPKDVSTGETSTVMKGNVMSPYVFKEQSNVADDAKEDVLRGVLKEKTFGDTMRQFYDWLDAKKIRLADIIDSKLADIMSAGTEKEPVKVRVMKLNKGTLDPNLPNMDSIYFLVVEYDDAMKRKYTERDRKYYGEPLNANGKQWIPIGTLGWSGGKNTAMQNTVYGVTIRGPKSLLNYSNDYFRSNPKEEAFVDETKYTHVAAIYPGTLVKRLPSDGSSRLRNVSEILADEGRNPNGLGWSDLKFGIQLTSEFKTVGVDASQCYSPISTVTNVGNVFLMVQGADGKYVPAVIKPERYNEMKDGVLKGRIDNALRQLTSPVHQDRYNAMLDLYQMLVFGSWDKNGYPQGNFIDFGTEKVPVVKLYRSGESTPFAQFDLSSHSFSFGEFMNKFSQLNPRVNINRDHLTNESRLMELDEAGALQTDIARLTKGGADYTVYSIGEDGKPVIPEDAPKPRNIAPIAESREKAVIMSGRFYFPISNGMFRSQDDGSVVTDTYKILQLQQIQRAMTQNIGQVSRGDTVHYILRNADGTYDVMSLNRTSYEPVATFGKDSVIAEFEAKMKAREDASRAAAAESALKSAEETKPVAEEKPAPSAVTEEYVDDDEAVAAMAERKPDVPEAKTEDAAPVAREAIHAGKESILERNSVKDLEMSENGTIFAGEQLINELFDDMDSELYSQMVEAIPEIDDMSANEFIGKIRSLRDKKGDPFPMIGITDKENWFETLKGCWL